jgi:hypothetical protein
MRSKTIAFLLAVCSTLVFAWAKTLMAQKESHSFRPPPVREMYVSWRGQPIAEIGLKPSDLNAVLSTVLVGITHGAGWNLRTPSALEKELLARYVDMGEGAANGLDVHGKDILCGASGNCGTWFFRRSRGKWQLVLDGQEPAAFAFVQPKHDGLLDLVLLVHLSADEAPTDVWQFNGTKFELLKSYCSHGDGRTEEGKCL